MARNSVDSFTELKRNSSTKGKRTNPNIPATYTRHYWKAFDGFQLTDEDGRERFDGIGAIPIR